MHPDPEAHQRSISKPWFILGCILLLCAMVMVLWGFYIKTLTHDQWNILMWILPIASAFVSGSFAGSIKATGKIATFAVSVTGGAAVWALSYYLLKPPSDANQQRTATSEAPEDPAEKRRVIHRFVENHSIDAVPNYTQNLTVDHGSNGSPATISPTSATAEDRHEMKALSHFMDGAIETSIEREIPYHFIKEAVAFDETPEGTRILKGYKEVMRRFSEQSTNLLQEATEVQVKVLAGKATEDELLRMAEPNIPPYMKDLFTANNAILGSVGTDSRVQPLGNSDPAKTLRWFMTILRSKMMERLSKLIEAEFTLDEIHFQAQYYRDHPALTQQMAKLPEILARTMQTPDPLLQEKLRRALQNGGR